MKKDIEKMNVEDVKKNDELNTEVNSNKNNNERKKIKKPILTESELKLRKARKKRVAFAAFILLLGIGVMGNWYYENTGLADSIEPLINTTDTKTLGEAEFVGGTTQPASESEYFSSARVDRQASRDKALENLQNIIDKSEEGDSARKEAEESIAKISSYISIENKIETLVTAKGVNNCLAVVSEDGTRVDVIVDTEDLSDTLIMQIKEIAMQQLGCSFENVSIIQSK